MKPKILPFLFIVILSISFVSPVQIAMKDSVQLGESVVIHVTGEFVEPISKEDITFKRRHMDTSIYPFYLDYIDGDYYISFNVPLDKESPDNYSINIKDVNYMIGPERFQEDISKDFFISSEKVPFIIVPALTITNSNYSIKLQNLRSELLEIDLEESEKTSEYLNSTGEPVQTGGFFDVLMGLFTKDNVSTSDGEVIEDSEKIYLESGETKSIDYPQPEKSGFRVLEFFYEDNAYGAMIYSEVEAQEEISAEDNVSEENATQEVENETDDKGFWESIGDIFKGNQTENTTDQIGQENETVDNQTSDVVSNESGVDNETSDDESNDSIDGVSTCEEMGGQVCVQDEEICEGDIKYSKSTVCCVGECVPVTKSNTGKTVGWILIIAIAIFVTWFLKKKYARAKPKDPNLLEIGRK